MDQEFRKLITDRADAAGKTAMAVGSSGWLDEITVGAGEKAATYRLKPLAGLYAQRADEATIDPQSEAFRPLLHGIESQIVRYDIGVRARLTDAVVLLSLGKLAMSPEGDAGNDVLANRIQIGLRLRSRYAGLAKSDFARLPFIQPYIAYYRRFGKTYHVQLQLELHVRVPRLHNPHDPPAFVPYHPAFAAILGRFILRTQERKVGFARSGAVVQACRLLERKLEQHADDDEYRDERKRESPAPPVATAELGIHRCRYPSSAQ